MCIYPATLPHPPVNNSKSSNSHNNQKITKQDPQIVFDKYIKYTCIYGQHPSRLYADPNKLNNYCPVVSKMKIDGEIMMVIKLWQKAVSRLNLLVCRRRKNMQNYGGCLSQLPPST